MQLINTTILCPFCGQPTTVTIDTSAGDQDDVEDCSNCCNPIHVQTHIDEVRHKVQVFVDADDDQYY